MAILSVWLGRPPEAGALLNIDGSRNQVFVFGSVTFGYDSNVFYNAVARGDYSTTARIGMELKRRAGIIAVNANFVVDFQRFGSLHHESSNNPSFYLELNKTSGRTTGAFTLNAFRISRADGAVNQRTTSWSYPLGLNIKYPINDHLYTTFASSYIHRRYEDLFSFANYTDYTAGLDLFYVFTSKLDLFAGYQYRDSSTTYHTAAHDHTFSLGASGGLLPKLNGTVRFGYQYRDSMFSSGYQYPNLGNGSDTFSHLSSVVALTWNITRKFTVHGQVARDFMTTATADNVDNLVATIRATYVFTRRFEVDAGAGSGRNQFLNRIGPHRRDEFFTWDVGARFTFNEHLKIGGNYSFLRNRSTLSNSDFQRSGYSIDISSRF